MALLVGSGLAVAGVAMQALFKNPLADPYVLGASSGAGFGAALIISLGLVSAIFVPPAAFAGAIIATFTVYALSMIGPRSSVSLLLLSGIALSTLFSALISYLMFVSGENLHQLVFWLMGGLWASSMGVRGDNVPRDSRRDGHHLRIRARLEPDAVRGRISAAPRRGRGEPQEDPLGNRIVHSGGCCRFLRHHRVCRAHRAPRGADVYGSGS